MVYVMFICKLFILLVYSLIFSVVSIYIYIYIYTLHILIFLMIFIFVCSGVAVGRWPLAVCGRCGRCGSCGRCGRWPFGSLVAVGPWAVALGPLALWPFGPWPLGLLAPWPLGPLAPWPLPVAVGPWPLAVGCWAVGLLTLGLSALDFGRWASALAQPTLPCLLLSSLLFLFPHREVVDHQIADHFQVNPGVWLATLGAGCHAKAAMYVGCPCGESAHVDRSGFFGSWWFEDTTPTPIADVVLVALCVYAGGA